MDFFLFVLLLVGFASLYVALQVYFLWTMIILVVIAVFYVVVRYPRGKDDWPFGFTDNIYLIGMTNVIVIVFMMVMPQLNFMGSTLTYPSPLPPEGWSMVFDMRNSYLLLNMIVIMGILWLIAFAILVPYMQRSIMEAGGGGGGGEGGGDWSKESSKPKIGMGA